MATHGVPLLSRRAGVRSSVEIRTAANSAAVAPLMFHTAAHPGAPGQPWHPPRAGAGAALRSAPAYFFVRAGGRRFAPRSKASWTSRRALGPWARLMMQESLISLVVMLRMLMPPAPRAANIRSATPV